MAVSMGPKMAGAVVLKVVPMPISWLEAIQCLLTAVAMWIQMIPMVITGTMKRGVQIIPRQMVQNQMVQVPGYRKEENTLIQKIWIVQPFWIKQMIIFQPILC